MKTYKFPKRFEIEGIDPLTVKVKVLFSMKDVIIFDNIQEAEKVVNFDGFHPFMACKHEDKWCLRLETSQVYAKLSV